MGQSTGFKTEAELCRAYLETVPKPWVPYPETAGWDLLMVHPPTHVQVGIQAKMTLNAKVLLQAVERMHSRHVDYAGPDFRAVLVPTLNDNTRLAEKLGITVILCRHRKGSGSMSSQLSKAYEARPSLPKLPLFRLVNLPWLDSLDWHDCAPTTRERLPSHVPEVEAGVPSPLQLTEWKLAALHACTIVEKRGYITRLEFLALRISMSRWTQMRWIAQGQARGMWIPGRNWPYPIWKAQHPSAAETILNTFDEWYPKLKVDKRTKGG